MNTFTVVVVADRSRQGSRRADCVERSGMRILKAASISDAGFVADSEPVNLVLAASFGKDADTLFSGLQAMFGRHRRIRILLFADEQELDATLSGIESLPPEQRALLFSSRETLSPELPPARPVAIATTPAGAEPDDTLFDRVGLIGRSPEIRKLKTLLLKIAPTGTTILLQGESGTGKEVVARSIHYHSSRSAEAFVPVDCAAISENIIESELFGHVKGAFTGADRATLGLIRSADKGTLFLDEIGELPLLMQAKLLRTLQERAVKPVGDSRIYPVDIRIVAATNRNLAEAVKQGTFRQDLYYRLNAITIYAPPLRERRHDIPLLCDHFISRLVDEGYPRKQVAAAALDLLCAYDWPGNIRELENVIRRAVTLASGPEIDTDLLSIEVGDAVRSTVRSADEKYSSVAFHEKDAILKALNRTNGNRKAAAQLLDISEATLYRRLKLYSL